MKNLITILTLFLAGLTFGQECNKPAVANYGEDEEKGKMFVSLYGEPFKQKNYKEAMKYWWKAQEAAPKYKPILYSHGSYMYKKAAKSEKDAVKKLAYADTLIKIYDLWADNFGDCKKIQIEKGIALLKYKSKTDFENAYALLNKGIYQYPANKVKSSWVRNTMAAAYYMVINKKAECDLLLEEYDKLSQICDVNIKQYADNEKKKGYFENAQLDLDKKVTPCASCDKLEEMFKPKVEASPEDMELIKKAVKMLDGRKCNSSEFYMSLASKIHKASPTAESAVSIGNYWYSKKKYKTAKSFYEEGLTLTEDPEEKAKLYERMAGIELSRGSYKSAASYARKMSDKCKANGIIARAIAQTASSCGGTKIEASFVYCLAIDYANKAKGCVGSSTVNAWKNRLAGKADLFLNEYKVGQSVKVKCWGESTTIRAID